MRFAFIVTILFLCGCQSNRICLEPIVNYSPPCHYINNLSSAFEPLSFEERRFDWAKEMLIADAFATEQDYYRAITSYKRALFLMPTKKFRERRQQAEYGIIQCYYFGKKFADILLFFETSTLKELNSNFPAFQDLLLILYESYMETDQVEQACRILNSIEHTNPEILPALELSHVVINADLDGIASFAAESDQYNPDTAAFLINYNSFSKSVTKAQFLNAILPGAGYLYVGQTQTALTSFLINALFIAAAYHFFEHRNIAAGLITTSLEAGWYFGGINGAGIAANEYNERLYENSARDFLIKHKLFPILMLNYAF